MSDGTELAFSSDDGIVVTTASGSQPKTLLKSHGKCRPVRRWPNDHLLVACFDPSHVENSTLWDLNLATSQSHRVVTGAEDALVAHGRTWVQQIVDSGSKVAVLSDDGKTMDPVTIIPSAGGGDSIAGIDPGSGNLVVRSRSSRSEGNGGWLGTVNDDGHRVQLLLESPPSTGNQHELGLREVIAFDNA